MICNTKEMGGVSVETRSGASVGKVASFDLDSATGRLVSLQVKGRGFVSGLMADSFIVPWDAILEMTPSKVVIADGFVPVGAKNLAQAKQAVSTPTLIMRDHG